MPDHRSLGGAAQRSRRFQSGIRKETFAPEEQKQLRRFSAWEAAELILKVNAKTFSNKIRSEEELPHGEIEGGASGMRWFTIEELNQIRRHWKERGKYKLRPTRPAGKRALRVAVANFKGGAGKSATALHFAHAAALDGYKVLVIDFDPQATITHAMGLVDVPEERTVWGIIASDLIRETRRMNLERKLRGDSGPEIPLPVGIEGAIGELDGPEAFIAPTCWPTIDAIGSCANAAFVEFATAEYRMSNRAWSFFAAVDRLLSRIDDDRYDFIVFDCPPAIGYQSLNAVFAADILYIPTGPGYWEYDSTTSFMSQLSEALGEIAESYASDRRVGRKLPKNFEAVRVVLTRFETTNELHLAMQEAMNRVFGDWMARHPIELTRAVEQTGRFLRSIYEMDYRQMTRETWKRARKSFDAAYVEFKETALKAWDDIPESQAGDSEEDAA